MALLHAKTAAGRQEIEDRARRLPAALRSILLMVDGRRDDTELRSLLEGLRAPPDALEQLAAMELIEVVGGAAPMRCRSLASAMAANRTRRCISSCTRR